MKILNRRHFLIAGISSFFATASFSAFKWIHADKDSSFGDRSTVVTDGSKTITIRFKQPGAALTKSFPRTAKSWYNKDLIAKLCRSCRVKKLTTEVQGEDYVLDIAFHDLKSMKQFVRDYQTLKVGDASARRLNGVTAEVFFRI